MMAWTSVSLYLTRMDKKLYVALVSKKNHMTLLVILISIFHHVH